MKYISLTISILVTIIFSCSSGNNNKKEAAEEVEIIQPVNSENNLIVEKSDKSINKLTIHGKDIWIRDQPATGKVMMKLNNGDQCEVLNHGFIEMIRGDLDYWFKIDFNGQQGWVFGAQTSYKNMQSPINASTLEGLWDSFKTHQKNWVESENKDNQDEYQRYIYSENANTCNVDWGGEGPSSFVYALNPESSGNIGIINETAKLEGAAGFKDQWSTFIGLRSGNEYKMDPDRSHKFDGKLEKLIKLNEEEYILVTYQDTGDGIVMFHESYYNLFYINTSEKSVRMIDSELGLVLRNGEEYRSKDGYAILGSSIAFNAGSNSIKLTEDRQTIIENENGYQSYEPFDTLTTTYKWDDKNKRMEKE